MTVSAQFTRRGVLLGGLVVAGGAVCTGVLGAGQAWALDTPSIISCDGWDARSARSLKVHNRRPAKILIHHTATPNVSDLSRTQAQRWPGTSRTTTSTSRAGPTAGSTSRSAAAATSWRAGTAAWRCCAAGGAWSRARTAPGRTSSRSGIENEGTYSTTGPTAQQWNRLRQMCAYVCQQYKVRPTEIYGHRDFKDTACPGDVLYTMLPKLRPRWPRCCARTTTRRRRAPRRGRCCASPTADRTCRPRSTCCAAPATATWCRTGGSTGARRRGAPLPGRARLRP